MPLYQKIAASSFLLNLSGLFTKKKMRAAMFALTRFYFLGEVLLQSALLQFIIFHNFINEAIFKGFFGIHPVIAFGIFMNLLNGLAGVI